MATMFKLMPLFFIFPFFLVALSDASQESVEFLTLGGGGSSSTLAAALPNEQLKAVSASVLTAEKWTRTSVLANYPAMNITAIVVGHNLLCVEGQEHSFSLVLPTLRNIHYSLTRWGLQKQIKISASFSSSCLHLDSETFRNDIADSHIKPLLNFLLEIDSIYLVNPHSISASKALILQQSHSNALKNLGFSNLTKINFIILEGQSIGRKLSSIVHSDPFSPAASPDPATATLPPLAGKISPSPLFSPPFGLHLPPCNPSASIGGVLTPAAAPPSVIGGVKSELWCVAKPNVPQEPLQEAMDYACGEGGADCAAITPQGSCYYPNTVLAHASYAFNSYWQKTKNHGGTCGFGGTAMLISSDPSYRHCRFVLA